MAGLLAGWTLLHYALAAAGTWWALRYALSRQLIDAPGERRSHAQATPRGGGVGIVAALLIGAGCLSAFLTGLEREQLLCFCTGLLLVAGIGWRDDHASMSPWPRLLVHALAAALLAWSVWRGSGSSGLALAAFAAALVLANFWNFMDGIDGLAASQAAIVALPSLFLLQRTPPGLLALALFAACAGFLPFNFPRARIFLGDVGSGALGYAVAGLMVQSALHEPRVLPPMLLPMMPFVVDAGLTLTLRMCRGERWWTPHVDHAYQRLARRFGHARVTLGYALVALLGACDGVFEPGLGSFNRLELVVVWYAIGAAAWLLGRRHTQRAETKGQGRHR